LRVKTDEDIGELNLKDYAWSEEIWREESRVLVLGKNLFQSSLVSWKDICVNKE
jgi:hypothetical protein